MDENKPVDVNSSDITPITRQEIQSVNSGLWATMSVSALHDQLTTLQNRLFAAYDAKNISMATQLQKGIDVVQQLINEKMSPRQ